MSFVSLEFLIFFIVISGLYFAIPYRFRWLFLLAASYIFYAYWNTSYILLIIFSTFVDYWAARWIDQTPVEQTSRRKWLLMVSITVNLGVLFVFKYFNFFYDSAIFLYEAIDLQYTRSPLEVLLPVGISFYTFQSMSYTIDVYRGKIKPEKHAGIFATFIAFFPQLVAGPIERAENMLPQFRKFYDFDYDRITGGLRLILWGVFKKVVIADRVALYVNVVYGDIRDFEGLPLVIATVFFAIQIYCDFSAYSDIAIGSAQIMGFRLMDNFRQPYLAHSIRDFWRRWHISLSTWFRDYLYIPLGGNRVNLPRQMLNLMIVFVISGLWHGANWTFVVWGALHGLYLVIETAFSHLTAYRLPHWLRPVQVILTFALVCFAWIFFRADSIEDAAYVINHLLSFTDTSFAFLAAPFQNAFFIPESEFMLTVGLITFLFCVEWLDKQKGFIVTWKNSPTLLRWSVYYIFSIAILLSLFFYSNRSQEFIYFQF